MTLPVWRDEYLVDFHALAIEAATAPPSEEEAL